MGTGIYSLQSTDPTGANYSCPSIVRYDFNPEISWMDRSSYSAITFQGKAQFYKLGPPNSDTTLEAPAFWLFGGNLKYQIPFSGWEASIALDLNENPVIVVHNPIHLGFDHVVELSTPIALSYRLMAVESQALRIGLGGYPALLPQRASPGYGYLGFLKYELRGKTKMEFSLYVDEKSYTVDSNKLKTAEVGVSLKFSFWGMQGLTPPPDERGL